MMSIKKILKTAVILGCLGLPSRLHAQSNLGFEDGLNHWTVTGNVNIDNSNMHGGKKLR